MNVRIVPPTSPAIIPEIILAKNGIYGFFPA